MNTLSITSVRKELSSAHSHFGYTQILSFFDIKPIVLVVLGPFVAGWGGY